MITTPEQAVLAATCALARISTFKSEGKHSEGCSWCDTDPRDLCRMVGVYVADGVNASTIRLYESKSAHKTMEAMWLE